MAKKTARQAEGLEEESEIPITPDPEPELPPAEIKAAQYDFDGVTILLVIRLLNQPMDSIYALNATDQFGLSPWLRDELQRMVDAGEIVIEPAPEIVASRGGDDDASNELTELERTFRKGQAAP
jgi:hypothetical protein